MVAKALQTLIERPTPIILQRFLASVLVVVLGPLFGLLAITVLLSDGRPALFRQERAGLNGRAFRLVKFRTMRNATDAHGRLLPDDERLFSVGQLLRSTSLDELPELVNIARGEMAFVGPRPLPTAYVDRYDDVQRRRLSVLPGLTGWAQVNGRNAVNWDERFQLDLEYLERRSLKFDLTIIARTVCTVLRRDGISAEGEATMTEFFGSKTKDDE